MKNIINPTISLKMVACLLGVILVLFSCKKEEEAPIRPVNFTVQASSTGVTVTDTITFTDASKEVSSRLWNFEGGNIETSTEVVQEVIYNEAGRYETTLDVDFADGTSESRLFYVEVSPFVNADFSASATTLLFGSDVTFTNLTQFLDESMNSFESSPNFENELPTWEWEFPGGVPERSNETNPVIRYPNAGVFSVKLTSNRNYPKDSDTEEKTMYIEVIDVDVISPTTLKLCDVGAKLVLTYPEPLNTPAAGDSDGFELLVDGVSAAFTDLYLDPNSDNTIIFDLETSIVGGQTVSLNYTNSSLTAVSGSVLAPLNGAFVQNTAGNVFQGNVNFEIGELGTFPTDWVAFNPDQSVNNPEGYELVGDDVQAGAQALKINYDGSGDRWIAQNASPAPVADGGEYLLTFWAKASIAGTPLDVRVIEPTFAVAVNPDDFFLTTEWQEYSIPFSGTDQGNLTRKIWWQYAGTTQAVTIWVDNVKMFNLGCD